MMSSIKRNGKVPQAGRTSGSQSCAVLAVSPTDSGEDTLTLVRRSAPLLRTATLRRNPSHKSITSDNATKVRNDIEAQESIEGDRTEETQHGPTVEVSAEPGHVRINNNPKRVTWTKQEMRELMWCYQYCKENTNENYKNVYELWRRRNPTIRPHIDAKKLLTQKNYIVKNQKLVQTEIDDIIRDVRGTVQTHAEGENHENDANTAVNEYQPDESPTNEEHDVDLRDKCNVSADNSLEKQIIENYNKYKIMELSARSRLPKIKLNCKIRRLIEEANLFIIGNLRNIRKTKDGLLLETISGQQAKRLLQIQKLDNFHVSTEPHRSLNYAKGVIRCQDLLNCSLEKVIEGLASEGVIDIKRIKTKRDGELVDTANLILTFDKRKLPLKVRAAFYSLNVRPYIPDFVRCFNCQRFGHVSLACTKPKICVCDKPPHIGHICENPVCVNCKGEHSARSKKCPRMIKEINIKTKTIEKITYGEAKRKITISMPNSGTYSKK
ncbi:unnamed protein product [Psylliodes chrysocephalus]|uniref:CCHC-type domain-containing protein n=1 Tax=Psylliodes chrysocephalus TaxID=3402493 RepID=A0A9P0CTH8_9CUCU|nr:unnamed protein product [Psylliodes chrysocephala]